MIQQQKLGIWRLIKGLMLKYMPGFITCSQFDKFITSYLDGELDRRELLTFELHLKMCRECRDYLAAYERTVDLSRSVFKTTQERFQKKVPDHLIKAILEARKDQASK